MRTNPTRKHIRCSSGICGLLAAILAFALFAPAPALCFELESGDVTGSLDSTLSYGAAWRVDDRDPDLIGRANGGNAFSVNFDDGNLNYDEGELISHSVKINSELSLDYKNFGLFVRGSAFFDLENQSGDRARTELRSAALNLVGKDVDLLDAYISYDFEVAEMPGQIRVGDQVLSWGESTFIQNGINVINPFAVSKLRVAGAELKEGLVPVGMVSASLSPTENITFEAFYQYDWKEVVIDPPGSYWSTNDFVGRGGDKVMLGFGDVPDQGNLPAEDTLLAVPRAPDIYADEDGQYGFAVRVYAPGLNDTEFGFYFMNYHSRLPVISSWTGDATGLTAAGTIAAVAPTIIGTVIGAGGDPTSAIAAFTPVIGAEAATAIAGSTALAFAASGGDIPTASAAGSTAATAFATDAYAKTANYQVEYPEDIKLYGVSFNTLWDRTGIALQGEYSFRQDVPLQLDDIELLLATLEPLANPILDAGYSQFSNLITAGDIFANLGESIYIPGFELFDVSQAQMTATKLFGPIFGASQFALVGEVGVTHVHDLPSKEELRLDGPGTPVTGNPDHADPAYPLAAHPGKEAEPADAFADATSWGYRIVGKLDFNNAIGAVTLSPRIAWAHDVSGTSPGPGGNFVEDRKTVTLGIGANYQNTWTADLSYTEYFGAGRYNLINDRDFVALNVKYSF